MTNSKRILLALTLSMAIVPFLRSTSSGQVMHNQRLDDHGVWNSGELKQVFSRLGNVVIQPLGVEHIEGGGVGLTFYVGWGEVAPITYSQVSKIVEQFQGLMKWSARPEFNNRGMFISAMPVEQARRAFRGESAVQKVSLKDLSSEMERFCEFTRGSLESVEPILNNSKELELSAERFEESEYRVFLVANPEQFSGSPTSPADQVLHFGITNDEWLLLSGGLNDSVGSSSTVQVSFLSRLRERYERVKLTRDDVGILNVELASLQSSVPAAKLKDAIRKLRRILDEASEKNLGVFLEPND